MRRELKEMNKKVLSAHQKLFTTLTWIIRLLCGAVFIYSGFVKAIDPWGTLYKLYDYFATWHVEPISSLLLVGVFALCVYEFLIGIFLWTGCFRRSTPIFGLLFMCVMLPLTFWIALFNPVADCGCFGDALILTNWQTFWKNIVITGMLIWLIKFNSICRCLIRPSLQWGALLVSIAYIVVIGFAGYYYQPLLDFRPFPKGKSLVPVSMTSDTDTAEFIFVYAKDGIQHTFTIDDQLPDEEDGWTFIERKELNPRPVKVIDKDLDTSFRIWSEDGEEDVTEDVIHDNGNTLLLLMPDLDNVSISTTWKINSLYKWAEQHNVDMMAVVASTPQGIERWYDLALPEYPIYTAEDTLIKMLARGNPAVVYLHDGVIQWKSTLRALPNSDFADDNVDFNPEIMDRDTTRALLNITFIYIAIIIVIGCLSFLPSISVLFRSNIGKSR